MEMRLELMPIDVLASDDEIVESSFFLPLAQILSHVLVVVQDFIVYAALGMAGIVSRETVPAAGQSMEQGFAFFEFIKVQIKNASPVAVHKSQPQAWLRAQDQNQWLQVKAAIDEKLSIGKLWRQFEFA